MENKRDYQKSKVYKWEDTYISPKDTNSIPFNQIQPIVNYVWSELGLEYPPKVLPIDKRKTTAWATGCRMKLKFHERGAPTWVILHELAHSLTSDFDNKTHSHDANFVGMYVKLLNKFLGVDMMEMLGTLKIAKVKINLNISAVCA